MVRISRLRQGQIAVGSLQWLVMGQIDDSNAAAAAAAVSTAVARNSNLIAGRRRRRWTIVTTTNVANDESIISGRYLGAGYS